jgi:hypothetical protein
MHVMHTYCSHQFGNAFSQNVYKKWLFAISTETN